MSTPTLKYAALFQAAVRDLMVRPEVASMSGFIQHSDVTCLEHCVLVAYVSFVACRLLRFDARAAARGGLLHDLFLYDWHIKRPEQRWHGFTHPRAALQNAGRLCALTGRERDIILRHMWPLTLVPPRHRESWVVMLADKGCALYEVLGLYRRNAARWQGVIQRGGGDR